MTEPKIRFLNEDGNFFPKWETTFIGEIVERQEHPVKVDKEVEYREIGIRSHGKGIFHKDPVTGKELGNKRVFNIVPGCLVLNIVFAWERAVAKTTADEVGMIASHRFPMYKPKDGILDLDYIVRYLISDKGKKILELASPGGAGRNRTLGQKAFMESELPLPCYEEQKKIAEFFDKIDDVISNVEKELEAYKRLKAGMLQKMFPRNGSRVPEVRFPGFTEDWEQRKLSDVAGVYDGVHQTPDYQDEGIMFLSVENIATMTSEKYISEEAYERDYKVRPEKGDILMTRIGDVGTPNVVETDEKLAYYVSLALLKPKGIDSYFLNNAIQSSAFQHGLRERTLLTAIPMKINKDEIGKVDISFPTDVNEQRKIGESFKQLDNLITLQQHELEEWNMIKTGYISKMFI